jgi:nitroimidazol reductase NimA-like FMN-containing flavoprotein (pyridoxamine 5'-phosphate oxidase superfamily)
MKFMSSVPPPGTKRRALLELTRQECLDLLKTGGFGRLAVNGSGPAPIVRPVNYVFDPHSQSVVINTAEGSKLHSLLRETHATFEVDAVDATTRTGWSVIIVGVTEALTKPDEIRRVEALELDSWTPNEKSHWVRIRAWTVSGRRLTKQPDPVSPSGYSPAP